MSPDRSGIPVSCIGTATRFASSIVTTNSIGSISPSWRFPMRRMTTIRMVYRIIVRMNEMSIAKPPDGSICRGRKSMHGGHAIFLLGF